MTGHKAFHHVHPIADSITFQVHGRFSVSGSIGAFPGVVVRELWLPETRMDLMRNQLRDRSVMAVLTSQTMFPGVLTAIRVIQNSVVKEKPSPD